MQKKYSNLESFLLRTLPDNKYERIRGYEPCIVVSEKENKAYKFVILGDECIYLTENPPKTVQEALSLRDVVSVELVNDYPDFLLGEDKQNSQHLSITYWTTEPLRRRSFRKKNTHTPRESLSDLHGDRSNASTPLSIASFSSQEIWSDDHGYSSLHSLQPNRLDNRGPLSAREVRIPKKKKKGGNTALHTIQSEPDVLKSLKEELEEDTLDDLENENELGDIMVKSFGLLDYKRSTSSLRSARSNNSITTRTARPLPESPLSKPHGFDTRTSNNFSTAIDLNDLPQKKGSSPELPADAESTSCCVKCSFKLGKTRISPLCGTNRSHSPSDKDCVFNSVLEKPMKRVMPDVHIEVTKAQSKKGVTSNIQRSSVNSSATTLHGHERSTTPAQDEIDRGSVRSFASVSDFGSVQRLSLLNVDGIRGEKRQAVLNVYLLRKVSPMLMLIRSAWSNYLLYSTLMLNPCTIDTPKGSILKDSQRGKIELQFQELMRHVLKSNDDIDALFQLLNELKMAAMKNFTLKRLFWKNSDLFHVLVKQLQHYLPKSPTVSDKSMRTNEFEFVTLLIELLCLMFHESEIIPERTQALKAERGHSVVGLLMVLTCTPNMPDKNLTSENENLLTKFTKIALSTVFELFLMAKQANWSNIEANFYNISWMVSTLEEIKDTEKFVVQLISMVLKMISPSSMDKLTPEEAVLLYQEFSILETFLKYSPRLRTFICTKYSEEFKYFVQERVIMMKLSPTYPVYNILLTLIGSVVRNILPSHTSRKEKF